MPHYSEPLPGGDNGLVNELTVHLSPAERTAGLLASCQGDVDGLSRDAIVPGFPQWGSVRT